MRPVCERPSSKTNVVLMFGIDLAFKAMYAPSQVAGQPEPEEAEDDKQEGKRAKR